MAYPLTVVMLLAALLMVCEGTRLRRGDPEVDREY